jgi:hypothetical protein
MSFQFEGFKGICYQPFPAPYNPSTANNTWIFFGSDIAYLPMAPLWSRGYRNKNNESYVGRDDLTTMREGMGVNLIRLYDWEPRNSHLDFLNACWEMPDRFTPVLAPVSNYFLKEGYKDRRTHIPKLIRSFSNAQGTDYHIGINGIIIGNEPRLNEFTVNECIGFTKDYVDIERSQFPGHRKIPIGHPVDFATYGGQYPCWGFWDPLLSALNSGDIAPRLFLAPQTYNDAEYLFKNASGAGKSYMDLAWDRYHKPIAFTEIGLGRDKPDYARVVREQLQGCCDYRLQHQSESRLIGFCFFQFADKVWKQGTSEGMFGAHSHTNDILTTVQYSEKDFTHWDKPWAKPWQMTVDRLQQTDLYSAVSDIYKANN